jgi:hypothetical protein
MYDFTPQAWEFPVESQPVFDQLGNPIQGSQAVVRTDTNEVLGVHGSRYRVLSHDDVVNSLMDAVKESDLSSDYQLKVKVIEGGRKLRGEILFNNITIEPAVGDIVQYRISFFNSYDASWSFSQAADGLRLWCLNGCTTPMGTGRSVFKHTQSINVEGSAKKIAGGLDTFMNNRELWQNWMSVHVTDHMAEAFFKATIAKTPSRQQLVMKTNEKQLENLLAIWTAEKAQLGANKWALYNAMTYWATHTQDLKNPDVARRNREDAIAKAMKHDRFENLELEGIF